MIILIFNNTPEIFCIVHLRNAIQLSKRKKKKVVNHLSFNFFSASVFVASLLVYYTNLSNTSIITAQKNRLT